ncbi:hypothetical protein AADX89_12630, partial [Staphylococcus epidermidis]|uniref:hypothetical protein n=1 Tax=Staphylococcus epidermidis TaxID=1282 RepID=UPI003120022D
GSTLISFFISNTPTHPLFITFKKLIFIHLKKKNNKNTNWFKKKIPTAHNPGLVRKKKKKHQTTLPT